MNSKGKATRIRLLDFHSVPMRTFHMTWFAFFLCFFAWFGIAPLMAVVRAELHLSKAQIGNTMIASVAITILARLLIGWLCDRIGPRISYTAVLIFSSLPVMGIGFAHSYESFLLFRLGIGVIGASFVITQYHTSVMFSPNVVGTANATTAGWGNMGGGVTQIVMPLLFAGIVSLGASQALGWRLAMVVAGLVCLLTGVAYYFLTQDTPEGNFADLRKNGKMLHHSQTKGSFWAACKDRRVWSLFLLYGACFGVELTIDNIAALYFMDYFKMGLKSAGIVASLFGLLNIFGRTLGGVFGDKFGAKWGLQGRVVWLFLAIFAEGIGLILFSRMGGLAMAIVTLLLFSLFVQMSCGATYSVVPFINKKALGSVAGIVGAGGNFGAMAAGFLFKSSLPWPKALMILGIIVTAISLLAFAVQFSPADEKLVKEEMGLKSYEVPMGPMEAEGVPA